MLTHLSVRNFAVVEAAEIDLGAGLTVVTGETGAGKSLLVDALLLLSGARADTGMVRTGCARAELAAEFDPGNDPRPQAWLEEQAMDDGGRCLVRRVLAAEGGSRAWINGRTATLAQLAELGALLVEIHGQHEHQRLLERANQLTLLDAFGEHTDAVARVRELARRHRDLAARARALSGGGDRAARIDLLRHEVEELERWALPATGLAELEAQHQRLANASRLIEGTSALADALDGEGERNAVHIAAHAQSELANLAELDPTLAPTVQLLDSATIQLGEAAAALSRYAQDLDLDPDRFAEVDAHLTALHDLARRHRVAESELCAKAAELRTEWSALEGAGAELARLAAERKRCATEYGTASARLSQLRKAAGGRLGQAVTALMGELGMAGGSFAVELTPQPAGEPDPQGLERCEFLVSANPGMPPRALRKVASGGELSRVGLAIEVAALGTETAGTMVFDEVDAGIGGAVAEVVGAKLRAVGTRCQVLCVTHLPQVAAQGQAHISVSKAVAGEVTRTRVTVLDASARREELARMLGGIDIDPETRAHARRMLEKAREAGTGNGERGAGKTGRRKNG